MLSFICATNNINRFNEQLKASLDKQRNQDFELIRVDTAGRFKSAVDALNYGASLAKGDYYIFLHHDIIIEDEGFIDKLNEQLSKTDFLIAGCAGAIPQGADDRIVLSNIEHGADRTNPGQHIDEATAVETLDECMFIIKAEVFKERPLKQIADTWHLHSVEYSMWANSVKPGSVLVLPITLWHLSSGASISKDYFDVLAIIRKTYRKTIYTTMDAWPYDFIKYHRMTHRRKKEWGLL